MPASNERRVRLEWTGEGLAFRGGKEGGVQVGVDSDGAIGPAPMELLLLSVAGCMAVDVLMILQKSRVPVHKLAFDAVELSRDKYCSVMHTLDPELDVDIRVERG